jgi:hydrogenase nickel incorporation protein HypA/HybF
MHEYSIVQALLARIDAESRARGARSVRRIRVRVGELSGIEPELLASAYELCREHTICTAADLEIEPVVARWSCSRCGRPIAQGGLLQCAACGAPARLVQGDEIILEQIEMEVP